MKIHLIIFGIVVVLIIFSFFIWNGKNITRTHNFYYKVNDINKKLLGIDKVKLEIYNETTLLNRQDCDSSSPTTWSDWPELKLYNTRGKWKIFPFYAFGMWLDSNCKRCPAITRFLKSIPGLKLATLSKLTPGMKLTPHYGWASHSNNVIRCHYGLVVPKYCYVSVSSKPDPPLYSMKKSDIRIKWPNPIVHTYDDIVDEEIHFHEQFKWLIFDDSKVHYAHNAGKYDRVVLILDVERPNSIEKGTSKIGDSDELKNVISHFRNSQKITYS